MTLSSVGNNLSDYKSDSFILRTSLFYEGSNCTIPRLEILKRTFILPRYGWSSIVKSIRLNVWARFFDICDKYAKLFRCVIVTRNRSFKTLRRTSTWERMSRVLLAKLNSCGSRERFQTTVLSRLHVHSTSNDSACLHYDGKRDSRVNGVFGLFVVHNLFLDGFQAILRL